MVKSDRREKLALDEAYRLFQSSLEGDTLLDLFHMAKALKTVSSAINGATTGQFKLTVKLWHRIYQSLFDKLVTSYPSHVVIRNPEGAVLATREAWPVEGTIEVHPEGLKRDDDSFSLALGQLDGATREQLEKAWLDHGPSVRKDDFMPVNEHCTEEYCLPKKFIIGKEILHEESTQGKQVAYQQWWDLYWQSYCATNENEKQAMIRQMYHLESVWGNLYY
jgi:hypothetical protein